MLTSSIRTSASKIGNAALPCSRMDGPRASFLMASWLMKRLLIAFLLTISSIVSIFFVRAYRENLTLKAEVSELTETVESYKCLVESRDENLAHSRLGTSMLCRLALSKSGNDVFKFLGMTPVGSLNCKMIDLAESPETKLLWYTQKLEYDAAKPISSKETKARLEEAKAVLFVVDFHSLSIVDHVMIKNFNGVSKLSGAIVQSPPPYQYLVGCHLPDGTPVEYQVSPTGFERIQ
ncbi:hypothetical protein [Rhodopirellula halodulae]|uniref:hypothetical protein n=1 Tax=Rhodopirellula halodulae TaxID=2894198 RepID=UPI001E4CAFAE|nr:hypothetical protein [Rhodopirellula sp. JC737]